MLQRRSRLLFMLFVGWPLLSVLANGGRIAHWLDMWEATALQIAGEMALWALLGMALSAALWLPLRRWLGVHPLTGSRLLVLVALCVAVGLGFSIVDEWVHWPMPEPPPPPEGRPPRPFWAHAFIPGAAMFAWLAVQVLMDSYERLASERERALRAETLATESRLALLHNELNPHFLFNALNSVIGVISEDPPRAQRMVRQLAGLLRHALRGPEVSTLGDEVDVAIQYLAIEQVRFEDRLQVGVDLPDALASSPVPPMLLQPLVENAVKHGMGEGVLTVRIEAAAAGDAMIVRVANAGRLGPLDRGVGLRNLRDRLAVRPGGGRLDLSQEGADVVATLTLPREAS